MRPRVLLAFGAVLAMAVRWQVSVHATVPRIIADETAYLAMARYLAGGETWHLGSAVTYGPGYSLILSPLFRFDLSPDQIFRSAIYLNILFGGLLVLAGYALTRRLTTLSPTWSVAAATVAACLPALVVTTNFAWSDNLAPLTFTVLVLALLRFVESPTLGRTAVLVALQVGAYAVHGRFAPLAAVVLLVVVVTAWQRKMPRGAAAFSVGVLAAGMAAVWMGSNVMYDALYEPDAAITQTTKDLDRVFRFSSLSISAAGQTWYLLVTTAGIAGFGVLTVARETGHHIRGQWSRRRSTASASDPEADSAPTGGLRRIDPVAFTALVAMVLLSFVISVGFMTDRPRPDQLVYGRYNDAFVGLLLLIGLASLATTTPIRRRLTDAVYIVVGTVGTGAVVFLTRLELLKQNFVTVTIEGLLAIEPLGTQRLRVATVIGLAATLLVVASSLVRRHRAFAVFAVVALLSTIGSWRVIDRFSDPTRSHPETVTVLAGLLDRSDTVWFTVDNGQNVQGFYSYPFYAPWLETRRGRGAKTFEDGHLFVMDMADQPAAVAAGYRLVWVDPSSDNALWVGPGARQDQLAADGDLLAPTGLTAAAPDDDSTTIEFVEGPTSDGDRITATIEIDRPTTEPWPTLGPGADSQGRVRIGVQIIDPVCDCAIAEERQDLDGWITADDDHLLVHLDVEVPDVAPGDYTLSVQVLRERVARFGEDARAPVTVPGL